VAAAALPGALEEGGLPGLGCLYVSSADRGAGTASARMTSWRKLEREFVWR